jgi:thiol-disulfide isomerase/thioredoxin
MIWILLFFVICASVLLTGKDSDSFFRNIEGIPQLVEIWEPWCPHCRTFREIWANVSESPKYSGRVLFGDVNCGANRSFCRRFPGDATPRIFWFDHAKDDPIHYTGTLDIVEIESFIERQLHPGFHPFSNMEEVKDLSHDKSVFLFEVSKTDLESLRIIERVAVETRQMNVGIFLNQKSILSIPTITWFSGGFNLSFSDASWSFHDIFTFVRDHSLPFMTYFSYGTNYYSQELKLSIFVFLTHLPTSDVNTVGTTLSRFGQTSFADCRYDKFICRYTRSWPNSIAFINYSSGLIWSFNGKIESQGIEQWANDIIEGKLKGKGPGRNWYLRYFWELRAIGGFRYYFLLFPLGVSGLVIIALAYGMLCSDRPQKSHDL